RDKFEPARARREVDLRDVTRDDHFRAEAESREEHLHLLWRGVLRLIEHNKRVIERTTAHVGERRDLDGAAREELRHEFWVHHLVERVVQRTEVRVDLVREGSREKAQSLARLDRGTTQDDAVDLF